MRRRSCLPALLPATAGLVFSQQAPRQILEIHTPSPVTSAVFAKTGSQMVTLCKDAKVRVWSLPESKLLRTIDPSSGHRVNALSDDGRWMLTGDRAGNMALYDITTGQARWQTRLPRYPGPARFSHDGKLLALAAQGDPVQVFEAGTMRKLYELESPIGGTNSIAFSRDDSRIATVDGDTLIRIYDAHTGRRLAMNNDSLVEPFTIDFTTDGRYAIAAGGDKVVLFLDAATGKVIRRMDRTAEPASYLELSPDGKALVTSYMKVDNLLLPAPTVVWDVASEHRLAEWLPPTRPVGMSWVRDGRLLAATAAPDALHIWRLH
ncbi:MAG: PQQ-binding-like beta-propeller repeat protein [Bryobacterales bacterium]|nr:PQQ-binding-like beta-propeller repeat protein [Bryobacterales bacterium]